MDPLIKELLAVVCRCGRRKRKSQTFCGECYWKLPNALRMRLYNRLGTGYEDAYREACAVVDAKARE